MSLKAANISLEGEYTVNIRDKSGRIVKTIGPHKNFITSMGLSYPYSYSFADCFRYMSLGYSGTPNTITGTGPGTMGDWGTVTLVSPEPKYAFIGSRSSEIISGPAETQYSSAGYREHSSGISIYRSWMAPSDGLGLAANTTFREIMLTPGKPAVTGMDVTPIFQGGNVVEFSKGSIYDAEKSWSIDQFISGAHYAKITTDPEQIILITGNNENNIYLNSLIENYTTEGITYSIHPEYFLCNCRETMDGVNFGPDASYVSSYYSKLGTTRSICRATGAFVRIVKDFVIESGQNLELNYTLNVNVSGDVRKFIITPAGGKSSATNWRQVPLTGYHALIHHGLKLITPENGIGLNKGPWDNSMSQFNGDQTYNSDYDYGESFIGSWGCPLEPFLPEGNSVGMISTDNLQFFVSPASGGASSSTLAAIPNTGLMGWRASPNADPNADFDKRLCNIRTTGVTDAGMNSISLGYWPMKSDYRTETNDPGKDLNHEVLYFKADGNNVSHVIPKNYVKKDRTRYLNRNFQFVGEQDFLNVPIRSIVLGYRDSNYSDYIIPYFDCLFPDAGGNLLPKINSEKSNEYSTGDYSYWYRLEENSTLIFSFTETWGSPCSPEVDGC